MSSANPSFFIVLCSVRAIKGRYDTATAAVWWENVMFFMVLLNKRGEMAIAAVQREVSAAAEMVFEAEITGFDSTGRGVARRNGKAVFVGNALPGERVRCRMTRADRRFDEAEAVEILRPSSFRQTPPCPHYEECGGCSMQHIRFEAQVALKQRVVEEQFARIGGLRPQQMLAPVYGAAWHYRERGRLGAETDGKGRLKIGFRAKKSNRIAAIQSCKVLPVHLSDALPLLQTALQPLADVLRGIAFAVGGRRTALCLLTDKRPSEKQRGVLRNLSQKLGGDWLISWQYGVGEEMLYEGQDGLSYRLADFDIEMPFCVGDFTQANAAVNNIMVRRAVDMLDPAHGDKIADLFCGLGNFTLPLAQSGAQVVGVEGSPALVRRAAGNARLNGFGGNVSFEVANLFKTGGRQSRIWQNADKLLIDPPRAGAYEIVKSLGLSRQPDRIVYVSCNPATFARDAAVLVDKGYKFKLLGLVNLFPQTEHVESVGCFER